MPTDVRRDVLVRLRRAEGQIRGLQRMIEREEPCQDVVRQLSAVRRALDKAGFLILSHRMEECVGATKAGDSAKAMDEAMKLFLTLA